MLPPSLLAVLLLLPAAAPLCTPCPAPHYGCCNVSSPVIGTCCQVDHLCLDIIHLLDIQIQHCVFSCAVTL